MAKKRKLEAPKGSDTPDPAVENPIGEGSTQEPMAETEVEDEAEHIAADEPVQEPTDQETLTNDDPKIPDPYSDPPSSAADGGATAGNGTAGENSAAGGDDDLENDPASIQKLLEPFPKDQLIELLRDAAAKHPDVLDRISQIADEDPIHRKIFVHGLGWDTNAQTLAAAFREHGEIEDCNAVIDKITGKSKGYGFILFKHRSGARRALRQPQKKIGNRMTACQMASAGPAPPPAPPVSEYTQRKIFVSNVGADLDAQKLLQFFAKYGEIEEGPLGLDKVTGKPKGFALFVYKSIESAKKALEEPHKNFEGHILHCQKAIDGPKPSKPGFHLQGAGSHHGGLHQGVGGVGVHGSHFPRNENAGLVAGLGNHGAGGAASAHMMAPSAGGLGFNHAAQPAAAAAAAAAGLNPALGQALTAFLATQGAGLGLSNLLGNLGSSGMGGPVVNAGVPGQMVSTSGHAMQGAYGNQLPAVGANMNPGVMGGYGAQAPMQGGYATTPMGQGGAGRNQQGLGHMGGYIGH